MLTGESFFLRPNYNYEFCSFIDFMFFSIYTAILRHPHSLSITRKRRMVEHVITTYGGEKMN